ncbi:MAG: hypothetical protein IK055_06295 [Lachnospiraceae bacterium]|nr:hypothetical protein [Lachnospiraceae bacterium]
MKTKVIIVFSVMMFISLISISVTSVAFSNADTIPDFYNLDQLYQDWTKEWDSSHKYPDYFCGYWINKDNEKCFAVTYDITGKRVAEKIRKQCLNSSFRVCFLKYSFNELYEITEELRPQLQEYHIATGISISENRVVVTFDDGSTNESRLKVKNELTKRYGDKIVVKTDVVETYEFSYKPKIE